jgi:two-component system, chemotaxis family, protein-glutamate methylesterase/glutaminase
MSTDYKILVIGGSAGSLILVRKILESLPFNFPLPIVLCLHRRRDISNGFVESLNPVSKLIVQEPLDKDPIRSGHVYLDPSNYHMFIEKGETFALSTEKEENYSRPSIDLTFESAGQVYGAKMIGIILSGANSDGAKGIFSSKNNGAYTIVQNPQEAMFNTMPREALKLFNPDKILTCDEIIDFLKSLSKNA